MIALGPCALPFGAEWSNMEANGAFKYKDLQQTIERCGADLDVAFSCINGNVITHIERVVEKVGRTVSEPELGVASI